MNKLKLAKPAVRQQWVRSGPAVAPQWKCSGAAVYPQYECSGTAGLHVVETMMGLFESAAYRQRVALPQEDRSQPLLRWRKDHELAELDPLPRDLDTWLAVEDQRIKAKVGS